MDRWEIGKIYNNGIVFECVSKNENTGEVKIKFHDVKDPYIQRYVDCGETYSMFYHGYVIDGELVCYDAKTNNDMHIWEVDPRSMKRQVSQLLCYWFSGEGFSFELDF